MTKKIFRSTLLVAVCALLASLVLIMGCLYDYFAGLQSQALRDELAQVAHELNADSIEQVVYAWILRLPSQPLPIIGSGKIERVRSAIVAEKLSMTRQQWFRIRKAALGYDVP